MEKVSKILESEQQVYRVKVLVEFDVKADNEGDAGYTADKIAESVDGYVSHEVIDITPPTH